MVSAMVPRKGLAAGNCRATSGSASETSNSCASTTRVSGSDLNSLTYADYEAGSMQYRLRNLQKLRTFLFLSFFMIIDILLLPRDR